MGKTTWTKHQDKELLRLWPMHSAAQIGRHLGVTRNAVIGRYGRLQGRYQDYRSPSAIKKADAAAKRRAGRAALNKRVIASMQAAIDKLADRNFMIQWAIDNGAQRRAIASAIGVSETRVGQICLSRRLTSAQ